MIHTVLLSTTGDSLYRFGATYVGSKQTGPAEVSSLKFNVNLIFTLWFKLLYKHSPVVQSFPVMVGDMDNSGSLNAQIIHQITNRIRSKVAFQVKPLTAVWTFSL